MITNKHIFGWRKESELQPFLETLFEEPLIKSPNRFANYDFETNHYIIELKSRLYIKPTTYKTYFIPTCKKPSQDKELVIFYYFAATDQLFYIIYSDDFLQYERIKNINGQETFLVPAEHFNEIYLS